MKKIFLSLMFFLCIVWLGCHKPYVKTPLEKAIDAHNFQLAEKLLSEGEDPNEQGPVGITPLECAVDKDDTLMIKLLLDHGANIHEFDPDTHSSLLHICVSLNEFNAVKFLITHGLNPDTPDSIGSSPLISAIFGNNISMITLLLKYGANPNFITKYKESPLEIALFERAELNSQMQRTIEVEQRDTTGDTRRAASLQIIQSLLKSGASTKPPIPLDSGFTYLHAAVAVCDTSVVSLLLHYGADKDAKDDSGARPYDLAVKYGCKDLETILK